MYNEENCLDEAKNNPNSSIQVGLQYSPWEVLIPLTLNTFYIDSVYSNIYIKELSMTVTVGVS